MRTARALCCKIEKMTMDNKIQYFGIVKWYDDQKDFGVIQCHEIGDAGFKFINLKNSDDITKLTKNTLAIFSIKKNKQGRNIAEKISFDYFQYVIMNYTQISDKTINVILNYADNKTKTKLQELIYQENNLTKNISPLSEETNNLDFLDNILKNNDEVFNTNLIRTLADGLGEVKNEKTFQSVKQLSVYNKQIIGTYFPELPYFIYQKSTKHFKFRLWLEGITDFCDLGIINNFFNQANETLKNQILIRCNADERGFLINKVEQLNNPDEIEEVYFDGIRDTILREISQAKENILVAVAWFTNHYFLDALCEKVKQGVSVEIIILNDYINNWIEGLDFQKFIDLGRTNGNSKFYFCDADNIMHHKFCIIDNTMLFNGSYNWTYYAEHRNFENCMFFKNKPLLIDKFVAEFDRLRNRVELIETIVPFDREDIAIYDLFSARQYRSKDLEYQAKEFQKINNIGFSSKLIALSLQINPENDEALKFQKEIDSIKETIIRDQAIDSILKQKQNKQEEIQKQIEQQAEQVRITEQQAKEQKEKDRIEKEERLKRYNEQLARHEEERQRLVKQEEEIRTQKELEEEEKERLLEIEQRKKELEEQERRVREKREAEQKEAEQKRIAEQKRQEEEKQHQAQILAQKQAEQQRIKEEAELLARSKETELQGRRGKLRINLRWETYDDLDLHVYDPQNNHIFYGAKQATCQNSLGQLDVDANAGSAQTKTPQENIFWNDEAPEGTYKIEVNHYAFRELQTCPFVVTIIPEFGEPKIFTGRVVGQKNTVTVAIFSYDKTNGLNILNSI